MGEEFLLSNGFLQRNTSIHHGFASKWPHIQGNCYKYLKESFSDEASFRLFGTRCQQWDILRPSVWAPFNQGSGADAAR